jgi:hypothetical protein
MLSSTGITENIRTIGCIGGGAHKYAKEFEDQLGKIIVLSMAFHIWVHYMHWLSVGFLVRFTAMPS